MASNPLELIGESKLTIVPLEFPRGDGSMDVEIWVELDGGNFGHQVSLNTTITVVNAVDFRNQLRSITLPGRASLYDYDGTGFCLVVDADERGRVKITTLVNYWSADNEQTCRLEVTHSTDQSYLPSMAETVTRWVGAAS